LGFFAPSVDVVGFSGVQPYKVVLWGEKSSLEPVLDPIAGRYGADLYLGTGETSDTLLHQMAENGVTDGRRIVVLCFCDCDPGGWQMPISIARKLQAFQALEFPELEFEVRRVALTPEQVREHKLPEAPLNESEKRAGKWKQAMGVEQTEIDALAVLNPALLRRIALDAIAPFYDDTLAARVAEVREAWRHEAQRLLDEQIDQEKLDRLRDEAEAQVEAFREEVAAINDAVEAETRGFRPPKLPAVPEPVLDGKQSSPPLIDSDWSFVDQTRRLKASRAYEDVA
jgi:hypothetical protein